MHISYQAVSPPFQTLISKVGTPREFVSECCVHPEMEQDEATGLPDEDGEALGLPDMLEEERPSLAFRDDGGGGWFTIGGLCSSLEDPRVATEEVFDQLKGKNDSGLPDVYLNSSWECGW